MNEENEKINQRADEVMNHLKNNLSNLTGKVEEDFPELVEDEEEIIDPITQEKMNEYLKNAIIDEVKENAVIEKNSIYDKRLKRLWYRKFLDALFLNE
jgi:hypothetical protein